MSADMSADFGAVTAYGYALSKGYEGTEEEYAELMARLPEIAGEAETAAQSISQSAAQIGQNAADIGDLQQTIGLKELPFNKDGFVRWRDGVLISGDDTKNTGFVETAGYNKIQISAQLGTVGALIAYYDSNNSFLQSISVEGRGSARPVTGIYDIPSQAAYLIVSNYNYLDNHARLIINDTVGDKISIIESDIAKIKTLKGKKIMFFGDSITAMSECYRSNLISYTGMTETYCLAISNARLCNLADTVMDGNPIYPSTNNTVPNQVQKVINNPENYTTIPDIILVAAGTNDLANVFTFDETQFIADNNYINIDNCDLKTCSGAMRWIYEQLMTLYPTAQVFFSTPIQASQGERTYSDTKNKRNIIIANAERMSVCYIDAFNKSGIYGRYETAGENGKYLADGLHPNSNGAVVLAKCIENGILENINH